MFLLRQSSSFQHENSITIEFPLARQYFVYSLNSYVATSITMLQHNFSTTSASWCRDPSFHVVTSSLFRLCCNTVLYFMYFCHDPESLSRQRLVLLSLTSCCSLALMLRHDFLMLSIFSIAIQFSCRNKTLRCSAYSCYHDPVCYVAT